jgi:hypothetical protein
MTRTKELTTVALPVHRRQGGADRRHKGGNDPFTGALEGQKRHCTLGRVSALRRRGRAWRAGVERATSSARRSGNERHEGHVRGKCFVHTSVLGAELDRSWPLSAFMLLRREIYLK